MRKILITLLAASLLAGFGCSKTAEEKAKEKEEKEKQLVEVKKYSCRMSFGRNEVFYLYTMDWEGEHPLFTETHAWDMKGWSYNKKKYAKLMKKEAKKLNELDGVTVTYTIAGKGSKSYETVLVLDLDSYDAPTFFQKAQYTFYNFPYLSTAMKEKMANSSDYYQTGLKDDLAAIQNVTCE